MSRSKARRCVPSRLSLATALVAALFLVLPTSAAFAGRLMATGHDADFHCASAPVGPTPGCSFMTAAISYVRGGAPDVTKKVLVIDNGTFATSIAVRAVQRAGVPNVDIQLVAPTPAALAAIVPPISTGAFSAIVVASDRSCGGCSLNPSANADSVAIAGIAVSTLTPFFNAGGGLLALSGARNAGLRVGAVGGYYDFLPVNVAATPGSFVTGFTPVGLGPSLTPPLTAANTNCSNCPAHNSFAGLAPLNVVETGATAPPTAPRPMTVIGEGVAHGGVLDPLPTAPSGLDHFRCYTVKPAKFVDRGAALKDQFGVKRVRVLQPRLLCDPVRKTLGKVTTKVLNPRAHLTCYATRDLPVGTPSRRVRLRNQFGVDQVTSTGRAQSLCVPSLKRIVRPRGRPRPPTGANPERVLDHFRCYDLKSLSVPKTVTLRDQFGTKTTRVVRLVRLCNPVQKTVKGRTAKIKLSQAHLACYSIKDATPFRKRDVIVRNQFERRRLRALAVETLCLPTFKQVLAVAGTSGTPQQVPGIDLTQFTVTLTPSACMERSKLVRMTVAGTTTPARPGATAVLTLDGPRGVVGTALTVTAGEDGAFTASTLVDPPATAPESYEWHASVTAKDGVDVLAEVPIAVAPGLALCPG